MRNLKIGARLAIGFAVVLSLMLLIAGIGIWRLQAVGNATETMTKEALEMERLSSDWVEATTANSVRTVALTKSTDGEDQKYFQKQISETSKRITEIQKKIEAANLDDAEKQLLADIGDKRKGYIDIREGILKMKAAGQDGEAKQIVLSKMIPALDAYVASVEKFQSYQKDDINKTASAIDANYRSGRMLLIGLAIAALVIGIVFSATLTVGITKPLNQAVDIAKTVASGDLSARISVHSTDETGQLMEALKLMNDSLYRTVAQVRAGTDTIATASAQIASGNQDLSSRTEEQASSLEETASSMEELTSTVRQNADNARQANQLAVAASDVAVKGGAVVSQVVNTMEAINASSKKIEDIISVIDGIAFQTNILALNAAVEAARAGEQGRGFAVVASEVRNLAQRSASAAREIKTLIDDSVQKVESGTKLVGEAGTTMDEVVSSIKRVHDIMSEITAASSEQSDGIEQVNQAVTQMDTVTQQNAALVEEAAAAAESLQNQAATLAAVVSTFKLGADASVVLSAKQLGSPVKTNDAPVARAVAKKPALQLAAKTKKSSGNNEEWEEF